MMAVDTRTQVSTPGLMSLEEAGAEELGPIAESPSTFQPGLFDLVDRIADSIDSGRNLDELTTVIPQHLLAQFLFQTGLRTEDLAAPSIRPRSDYMMFLRGGGLKRLRDWLRGIQVLSSKDENGWVIFAELHCPKVLGCTAYYSQKTENTSDTYVKLTVAGFGGGAGRSKSFGTGHKIPAVEQCRYVLVPVTVRIDELGHKSSRFERVSVVEIHNGFTVREVPRELDFCQSPLIQIQGLGWESDPFQAEYPPPRPPTEVSRVAKVGEKWKHSLGIEIGAVKFGAEVSVDVVKEFHYDYELSGPKLYHGIARPESIGYSWVW